MANALDHFVHRLRFLLDPMRHEGITDAQLLDRWATNRDSRAFAVLVGRHGALVWRVSKSVVRQAEEAEDVFQATFFVLARKAASLRKHSSVAGWLYQTAYNLALKARTAKVRRLHHEERATPRTIPNPLEEISVREAGSILAQELDRLSAIYREPLLLCLYEGATQDEAARQLGCSLNTLKSRLERGRALLSQRLKRRGLAPASALAFTLYAASHAPAQLIHKTITAATHFAAGEAVTGTAALLANAAMQTLLLKKAGVYLAVVLAMGSLTVAAGFAFVQGKPVAEHVAQEQPKHVEDEKPKPRVDALGDPLPPGAVQRIGSSRLRHFGDVTRMLYTPDGKAIVSTSGNYLYLWDAATGKQRWRLEMAGLEGPISTLVLAASADSTKVALLNNKGFFLVETATGKKLAWHKLRGPIGAGFFWWMAIAPDMSIFAVSDNGVRLHDAITGQEKVRIDLGEVGQTQYPYQFEFSADGNALYVLKNQKEDEKQNVVIIFDTRTGKESQTIPLPKAATDPDDIRGRPNKHLIRSQDDRFLAVMMPGIIGRIDATIVFWEVKAGKQRHLIQTDLGSVYRGVFSPDGGLLAISSDMPYVVFFDTATGQERGRLSAPSRTTSFTFSPDGKTLAFGEGGCITLCDVATGKHTPPSSETNALGRIQFTNSGKELLSIRQGVDWWDVTNAKSLRHLAADPAWFHISSVSPDGKLLVASLVDCDMVLIDAVTGKQVRPLDGHKILNPVTAFSPDGTKLYSAGRYITDKPGFVRQDPRIIILNVATGRPLSVLQSERDQVGDLAVSPDGRWLACGAYNGNFIDYVIRIWDLTTGKVAQNLTPLALRQYHPKELFFSADSFRLVSMGGEPGPNYSHTIQLWEVATGKEVILINSRDENIRSIAMTPDGRMLATGGNKTLQLWEVATGMERGQIKGHENYVSSLDFSPDGKLLASASMDAPVYIWNTYADLKPQSSVARLSKEDREKLWQTLADTDAAVGFHAMCELIAHPKEAVAFLEGSWKRLPRATPQQIQKWVDDLNSEQFAIRKTATTGLERFAAGQETLLREAFKKANSLETRQRLEKILGRLNPERLRRTRMLEVLEQIRTDQARQFLRALAEQKEDTTMAREAAAGLKRVEQQR